MSAREEVRKDLVDKIEKARQALNRDIDKGEEYELVYESSVKLDSSIEQYIVAGF